MNKNCYIVNLPGQSPANLYSDVDQNGRAKPFMALTQMVLKHGNCIICDGSSWDGEGMKDVWAVIALNSHLGEKFLKNISQIPKNKCFLVLLEPPVIDCFAIHYRPFVKDYFGTIFTQFDDLVDQSTYLKLHHWQARDTVVKDAPSFGEKKFCVMIQTNSNSIHIDSLYDERRKIAAFLTKDPEFDLFGFDWDGYRSWRGYLQSNKHDTLKKYKFVISYENMKNQRGFFTERIFDAFYAKSVPIYWGASNIANYIPCNTFIDRSMFSTNQELYIYLKNMDESTYENYIFAAHEFLKTDYAKNNFSIDSFANTIINTVCSRAGT